VFKLTENARRSITATTERATQPKWSGEERRGPDRARNVTRPSFAASKAANVAAPTESAGALAKTGTGDWKVF